MGFRAGEGRHQRRGFEDWQKSCTLLPAAMCADSVGTCAHTYKSLKILAHPFGQEPSSAKPEVRKGQLKDYLHSKANCRIVHPSGAYHACSLCEPKAKTVYSRLRSEEDRLPSSCSNGYARTPPGTVRTTFAFCSCAFLFLPF